MSHQVVCSIDETTFMDIFMFSSMNMRGDPSLTVSESEKVQRRHKREANLEFDYGLTSINMNIGAGVIILKNICFFILYFT